MSDRIDVPIEQVRTMAQAILKGQGYTAPEADEIAEVLLYAEVRGNDQGLAKLIGPGYGKDPTAQAIAEERPTPVSALVDGAGNAGILVMRRATALAAQIAQANGVAVVGTRGTASSTGCLGYYAKSLALEGLVSFMFAGSRPAVALHGSSEAVLGTNPIAVGIPTGRAPLVVDVATSAITWYSLVAASAAGRKIPASVAYDAAGNDTTDPSEAMAGAIRTFGQSHKSSALSVVVELLTGPLVGAVLPQDGKRHSWGNLMIAFHPRLLAHDVDSVHQLTEATMEMLKKARPVDERNPVRLPGERSDRTAQSSLERGVVTMEAAVYGELAEVAARTA